MGVADTLWVPCADVLCGGSEIVSGVCGEMEEENRMVRDMELPQVLSTTSLMPDAAHACGQRRLLSVQIADRVCRSHPLKSRIEGFRMTW